MVTALEPGVGDRPVVEAAIDGGPVDAGPIRRLVARGVAAARDDVAFGAEIVRDVVTTAPRDAKRVVRTGVAVARAVRPVADAVVNEALAGIPDIGQMSQRGADAVARKVARVAGGGWLSFSGVARWAKYRTRWDP